MKIVVMSDSHGNYRNVRKILDDNRDASMIIHLGDGEADLEQLRMDDPALADRIIYVCGNCDMGMYKRTAVVTPGGVGIFLAHGDNYKVKTDKEYIADAAAKSGCTAAFFGHTHERYNEVINGIQLLNPGSCDMQGDGTAPSYAVAEVRDGRLDIQIIDIKR